MKNFFPPSLSKSCLKLVCNVNIVHGNLQSENSQDYAQMPQPNCTIMNSASVPICSTPVSEQWTNPSHPELPIQHLLYVYCENLFYRCLKPEVKKGGSSLFLLSWDCENPFKEGRDQSKGKSSADHFLAVCVYKLMEA
jgi:hypothetical protein